MPRLLRTSQGTASIEFLVSFFPFFMLFLGGLHLACVAGAQLVVQHAAVQAARVAVVTLDDDPVFYDDGARKQLDPGGRAQGKDLLSLAQGVLALAASPVRAEGQTRRGDGRLQRIRNAAYLPLSVIGASTSQAAAWFAKPLGRAPDAVSTELAQSGAARVATGLALYARVASAVTFPTSRGSERLRDLTSTQFLDDEAITVRVTFLYPCSIPLARLVACKPLPAPVATSDAPKRPRGWLGGWDREDAPDTTPAEAELAQAEWGSLQSVLRLRDDARFAVLRAEATLPNQGAPYRYASEVCQTKRAIRGCGGG